MHDEFMHSGLNGTETKVLFYLLSHGPRSAGILSQNLKIKRTTIYSALEGLISLRLVSKEKVGGKMVYAPAPTDMVPQILLKKAELDFERARDAVSSMHSRLEGFAKQHSVVFGGFEIQRIQSTTDFLKILDQNIFTKDFCAIWNPQVSIYSETVKARIARFLEKTARRKNHIWDVIPAGPKTKWYIDNIRNENHQVRLIPLDPTGSNEHSSLADLIIVDDLVIVSLNVAHNESALLIKSDPFATFMRWVFKSLWNALPQNEQKRRK